MVVGIKPFLVVNVKTLFHPLTFRLVCAIGKGLSFLQNFPKLREYQQVSYCPTCRNQCFMFVSGITVVLDIRLPKKILLIVQEANTWIKKNTNYIFL